MFDLHWWLAAILLFTGCAVQTAIGFGMALLAAPIIVLFKPEWVPIILTIVALLVSLINAYALWHHVVWRHLTAAMISRLPGTLIGAWALTLISSSILQLLVAVMVFVAVIITAFAKPFAANSFNLSVAGFFSGLAGTTTSIGGPPMALVMQHGDSQTTRANLAAYFVYSCLVSLVGYQWAGLLSPQLWWLGLSFTPVALAGYLIGKFIQQWVDQRFRPLLLILCSLCAVVALAGAWSSAN